MGITVMEIALLIVSAIGFVISFLIPENKEKNSGLDPELAQEEIKNLIRQEVDAIRGHVEEVVDESMTYAMEKTERSLERLSNEKIMAVNEYSDTVMAEIHKNHEEVMFLYDMLNAKHDTLKKTVAEASKAAKTMQDTVESIQTFRPVEVSYGEGSVKIAPVASGLKTQKKEEKVERSEKSVFDGLKEADEKTAEDSIKDSQFMGAILNTDAKTEIQLGEDPSRNSNDKILELHKQGKSNVAIAKELGLGVGEVKLVIDLFKNL